MSEPIIVYRGPDGGDLGAYRESEHDEEWAALPRADFDALAAEAADARTLRAERDSLVKERERANQNVIESLAIARKALEENDRAEAVLIDKAGVDGDDLAACCDALLAERDAATARAEKAEARLARAEALLREAVDDLRMTPGYEEDGMYSSLVASIDALLEGKGAQMTATQLNIAPGETWEGSSIVERAAAANVPTGVVARINDTPTPDDRRGDPA